MFRSFSASSRDVFERLYSFVEMIVTVQCGAMAAVKYLHKKLPYFFRISKQNLCLAVYEVVNV